LFVEVPQIFLDPREGGGELAHGSGEDGIESTDGSLQIHEVGRFLARFGRSTGREEAAGAGAAGVASFRFAEPPLLDITRKVVLARRG
jgi:hypothetical protein